jgi:MEKHLA domain
MIPEPDAGNAYLLDHAQCLIRCYRHWTGRDLVGQALEPAEAARTLYRAPFVVLSHDASTDPRFDYANLAAQGVFEMPWAEIVGLPSRLSAEPLARAERDRLLARVGEHGYLDDYNGVRIARSGRRFRIRRATVWNLFDPSGTRCGQAACFREWVDLGDGTRAAAA